MAENNSTNIKGTSTMVGLAEYDIVQLVFYATKLHDRTVFNNRRPRTSNVFYRIDIH